MSKSALNNKTDASGKLDATHAADAGAHITEFGAKLNRHLGTHQAVFAEEARTTGLTLDIDPTNAAVTHEVDTSCEITFSTFVWEGLAFSGVGSQTMQLLGTGTLDWASLVTAGVIGAGDLPDSIAGGPIVFEFWSMVNEVNTSINYFIKQTIFEAA